MSSQPTTPPPPIDQQDGTTTTKKPLWKRWWFIAIVVVVVIVALTSGGDDEGEPVADPTEQADAEANGTDDATQEGDADEAAEQAADEPEDDEPEQAEPERTDDGPVTLGVAQELTDGSTARINAVTPDVDDPTGFLEPAEGTTYHAVTFELCAGPDGHSLNPLSLRASLEDNTNVDVALGAQSLATIRLPPGGCGKGNVLFEVPDGARLAWVSIDAFGNLGRFSLDGAPDELEPLTATVDLDGGVVGEPLAFSGGTATVYTVTPDAAPDNDFSAPPPGASLTALDAELCLDAGGSANPLYWYVGLDDNTVVGLNLGGQTFPTADLAPGECARGGVDFVIPEGRTVTRAYVTPETFETSIGFEIG